MMKKNKNAIVKRQAKSKEKAKKKRQIHLFHEEVQPEPPTMFMHMRKVIFPGRKCPFSSTVWRPWN